MSISPPARAAGAQSPSRSSAGSAVCALSPGAALLGRAQSPQGTEVHVLCWPMFPNAWPALTQALVHTQTLWVRSGPVPTQTSWLHHCSPRLGEPFRDSSAGESTLGALLTRVAMGVAVHVIPVGGAAACAQVPWSALSRCLSAYEDAIKREKRPPASELYVSTEVSIPDGEEAWTAFCRRQGDQPWLERMALRFCSEENAPLVLELTRVIAMAIARQSDDGAAKSPVFDAILPRLVNPPLQWRMPSRIRKR